MADKQLYEVESILGRKIHSHNRVFYLVRWRGFSSDHDTWEPRANLDACKPLIKLFIENQNASKSQPAQKQNALLKYKEKRAVNNKVATSSDLLSSVTKRNKQGMSKSSMVFPILNKKKRMRHSAEGLLNRNSNLKKDRRKRMTVGGNEIFTVLDGDGDTVSKELSPPTNDKTSSNNILSKEQNSKTKTKPLEHQQKAQNYSVTSKDTKSQGPSKAKKAKLSNLMSKEKGNTTESMNVYVISDEEEEDNDEDDDVLYSLNSDCDIDLEGNKPTEDPVKKDETKSQKLKKNGKQLKDTQGRKSPLSKDKLKKNGGKRKRISLMESKKNSKDWISKSGLFRSVSPPPQFTSVKHLMGGLDTEDPSKPSGNSLPDPVSPEASETYLADVPSSYPVPAEEPLTDTDEQPLSASSLVYQSFLNSLPMQLHPVVPGHKLDKKSSIRSGSSSSTGGLRLPSSGVGGEPVERRISVRSSECAFRYKQIVVKKCFRYTQIWLNTQTVMKNALNPQVIQEVVSALNSAKYDDSHLVLFSSLGNVFCSGTDLHFLISNDRKVAARQMADSIRDLTKTFITFPKPIIAAVSGAAVGMGVSLLALCDVVYASDKASFHLPYSQLSQTPEGSSSFTLPLTLGLPSANELLYGGRKITAMEAYNLGLVSQVFWPTLMMQEVIPRAENMATCSAKALEATKLLIRSHHRTKMELTNETECNLLLERWLSVDCQRAIEAYLSNEKNLAF
ncbi:chromodomain y-like protein 2 [Plakobranchus ocellatus]|uniref:Chromodomain y-like protein 2 n=1 Tax=Plakobranchus ocellatus TaxID=259542 RepID=A0AAV4DHI2_9GAST|nr:chromodomain y-like protein 2 [Plakobranchus ocellatus]